MKIVTKSNFVPVKIGAILSRTLIPTLISILWACPNIIEPSPFIPDDDKHLFHLKTGNNGNGNDNDSLYLQLLSATDAAMITASAQSEH